MARNQFQPHGSSHEKKISRKERKLMNAENPMGPTRNSNEPLTVSAPTEDDKKQIRMITIVGVVGLILLLVFMFYGFINS